MLRYAVDALPMQTGAKFDSHALLTEFVHVTPPHCGSVEATMFTKVAHAAVELLQLHVEHCAGRRRPAVPPLSVALA